MTIRLGGGLRVGHTWAAVELVTQEAVQELTGLALVTRAAAEDVRVAVWAVRQNRAYR